MNPRRRELVLRARGRAVAKAILVGEHFVVHGVPALAVPVPGVELEAELRLEAGPPPGGHLGRCLQLLAEHWGGPGPEALTVRIRSGIPVGAGLGSSAALSVALARAYAGLAGRPEDPAEIRRLSLACERLAHGNPSGIDTEVALTARPIRFERGRPPREAAVSPDVGLVVIDTGTSAPTAPLVAAVARRREADPEGFAAQAEQARGVVEAAEAALAEGRVDDLGAALDAAHRLLAALGVSSPVLDRAVEAAREAGAAGAKLTGSGGGGAVLAVCPAPHAEPLAAELARRGFRVPAAGPIRRDPIGGVPWTSVL